MVHGLFGVMPMGRRMQEVLGPEHPFFSIHARAHFGETHESVEAMAQDYLAEFRAYRPHGPYVIGGMCAGALIALEMARRLRAEGEHVTSVVMLEPNPVLNLNPPQRQLDPSLEKAAAEQISQAAKAWYSLFIPRFEHVPLDLSDPVRLEQASQASAKLVATYERYRVQPYTGRVDIIASDPFAKLITNAGLPWRKEILLGHWAIHRIACTHDEAFVQASPALLATMGRVIRELNQTAELARA